MTGDPIKTVGDLRRAVAERADDEEIDWMLNDVETEVYLGKEMGVNVLLVVAPNYTCQPQPPETP